MEVSGKTAGNEDNLSSLNKLCEPCEADNVNTQASGLCKECEEYMCNTCFRQHLKAKSCRNHTLIDTDAFSEACLRSNASAIKCKQHEADTIKYYCRTHEVVGCGDCIVSKHGGCKPEFIKDLSDNFQQSDNHKTFMNKLEKLISERNEFEKKIQMKRDENKLMFEKALGDIKQFRLDINKYLDKVEADITCQVKNAMEENETLLTKQKNYCTMLSTQLEEIKNMLNSELYKDNVLFIHTVECKQKLPESEKAISDMKPKSMKKYEFVCNKQMRSIVTSSQNLGNLAISPLAVFLQTTVQANEKIINQEYARENDERRYMRKGRKNSKGRYKKETIQMENDQTTRRTKYGVSRLVADGARIEYENQILSERDEYEEENESWSSGTSKKKSAKGVSRLVADGARIEHKNQIWPERDESVEEIESWSSGKIEKKSDKYNWGGQNIATGDSPLVADGARIAHKNQIWSARDEYAEEIESWSSGTSEKKSDKDNRDGRNIATGYNYW